MSLEEFANEVRDRLGSMSQRDLARLAGLEQRTIERLLGSAPPFTSRKVAIAIAHALDWEPDEALALLDHKPLSVRERARLGPTAADEQIDRLWPLLTAAQKQAIVNVITTMVAPHALPPATHPGEQGLRSPRGAGEIPDPRPLSDDNDDNGDSGLALL